jgi:HSP20 family protein
MNANTQVVVKQDGAIEQSRSALDWGKTVIPPADVYETEDAYVVMLDMPGAGKDAIRVVVNRGVLTVEAPGGLHRRAEASLIHREIPEGTYHRSFTIGQGIDAAKIDAAYEDGVLGIRLFKADEAKEKTITVR